MEKTNLDQQDQKNIKGLSKAIIIISKILKVISIIGIVGIIIAMLVVPFIINSIEVAKDSILFNGEKIAEFTNSVEMAKVTEIFNEFSHQKLIILFECVMTFSVCILFITYKLFDYLYKLFKNIYDLKTPFVQDNVLYIKKIGIYLLLQTAIPLVFESLISIIFNLDFNFNISLNTVILILSTIAMYYIFQYGCKLQEKTKGEMYSE